MPNALTQFQKEYYESAQTRQAAELTSLADLMLADRIDLVQYRDAMMDSLKQYYIQLALVAKGGRPLIARDRADIARFLTKQRSYLSDFIEDIQLYHNKALSSDQGVLARSGRYSSAWGVFTRFSLPAALADALPALPGLDCLGGMYCGCWLEWAKVEDGVEVYWFVNAVKEHCALCAGFDSEWSPLFVPMEDLDPDLMEEEIDFLSG